MTNRDQRVVRGRTEEDKEAVFGNVIPWGVRIIPEGEGREELHRKE